MNKEEILKALEEQRKNEKRKFVQSVDLIVNLKNFDMKREAVNLFVTIPHKIRDIKAAAFLNVKNKSIDTIAKPDFEKYREKQDIKKLVKKYDIFIAHASLMPAVATTFGRYLGPAGKMPSPQLGIITKEDDASILAVKEKAEKVIKLKTKEPCIKVAIGKENMKDEEIAENILTAYNALVNGLSKNKDNIKSVMIKFTMNKPSKLLK